MSRDQKSLTEAPASAQVAAFLERVRAMPAVRAGSGRRGRLLFAIDATASRQPTWDRACALTGHMFEATKGLGGLSMSLCYYRGYGEFMATPWLSDVDEIRRRMTTVTCLGGQTQIGKVLEHAIRETRKERVNALVFIGDAMEEPIDPLCHRAGELGMLGCPGFFFHEGGDALAGRAFRDFARLSGGAYAPFDLNSPDMLRDLLSAVAVYAAGGREALSRLPPSRTGAAALLTHQLSGRR
ncbi:VWA domain-containing protein [Elioraea thermophila]|uniref:VWA domain-containing protein n=1 Tax=Elioraea thermophila TaxID=2185104 RepID=UPI000DF28ED4|nr:VWA domain-containing protein [Elioraea thermophila]